MSTDVSSRLVSRAEYHAFCDATGREIPSNLYGWSDEDPVTLVSALDADAFCAWAGVRLPTEEEWVAAIGNKRIGPKSVWEWTATEEGNGLRVSRGGSWLYPADSLRAAPRSSSHPDYRSYVLGFRTARDIPATTPTPMVSIALSIEEAAAICRAQPSQQQGDEESFLLAVVQADIQRKIEAAIQYANRTTEPSGSASSDNTTPTETESPALTTNTTSRPLNTYGVRISPTVEFTKVAAPNPMEAAVTWIRGYVWSREPTLADGRLVTVEVRYPGGSVETFNLRSNFTDFYVESLRQP